MRVESSTSLGNISTFYVFELVKYQNTIQIYRKHSKESRLGLLPNWFFIDGNRAMAETSRGRMKLTKLSRATKWRWRQWDNKRAFPFVEVAHRSYCRVATRCAAVIAFRLRTRYFSGIQGATESAEVTGIEFMGVGEWQTRWWYTEGNP